MANELAAQEEEHRQYRLSLNSITDTAYAAQYNDNNVSADPHIRQGLIDKIEHWERTCSDTFYDYRNQEQADELLVQRLSGYSHDEIVYNYNFLKES